MPEHKASTDLQRYTTGAIVEARAAHDIPLLHWQVALEQWLNSLDSENTRRNYRATIEDLFSTAGLRLKDETRAQRIPRDGMPQYLEEIGADILTKWRGAMADRTHRLAGDALRLSPATMNRHLSAARAFFNYWRDLPVKIATNATGEAIYHYRVQFTGDAQKRALKAMRANVERPFVILNTDDEIAAIVNAAGDSGEIATEGRDRLARKGTWERSNDTPSAERDTLMITVALATGLRCAELAALTVGSLVYDAWDEKVKTPDGEEKRHVEAWAINVKSGKGNKDRHVWLSADDARAVRAYITATGRKWGKDADADQPLFVRVGNRNTSKSKAEKSNFMHVNSVRRIINAAADRAQASNQIQKTISPHSLRHTFAMDQLIGDPENGRRPASIVEVQEMLGHSSIVTTQKYLKHLDARNRAGLVRSISRFRRQV